MANCLSAKVGRCIIQIHPKFVTHRVRLGGAYKYNLDLWWKKWHALTDVPWTDFLQNQMLLQELKGLTRKMRTRQITNHTSCIRLLHHSCQPKISNLNFAMVPINEYVVTLQIPMYNWGIMIMKISQTGQDLPRPPLNSFQVNLFVFLPVPNPIHNIYSVSVTSSVTSHPKKTCQSTIWIQEENPNLLSKTTRSE